MGYSLYVAKSHNWSNLAHSMHTVFNYAYFFIYAVLKKSCYASIYLLFSDLQTYPFVLVSVCSAAESRLTLTPHEL